MDCLSIVVSRAGPETMGMLLAHRVPAVLCACIRHGSPDPRSALGAPAQPCRQATPPVPSENRALHPLAPSCVRALACLVHPTGPQWAPIRATPLREATVDERGTGSPSVVNAVAAASSGLAIDMKAAVDLGASVWRETATHLLKMGGSAGGGGCGSGGNGEGGVGIEATASMLENDGRSGSRVSSGGEAISFTTSAVSSLCGIICAAADGRTASRGGEENRFEAPPYDASAVRRRSPAAGGDGGDDGVRLAALRVLLHTSRVSAHIAHAIAAFDEGAAVQALLGRLGSATTGRRSGINVSFFCKIRLFGGSMVVLQYHSCSGCSARKTIELPTRI